MMYFLYLQQNHSSSQSLSMLEKSQRKQHINNEHRTNFRAGYIQINEEYLHKTGIRGRKKNLLYCFIALLLTIAIANIVVILYNYFHRFLNWTDWAFMIAIHFEAMKK